MCPEFGWVDTVEVQLSGATDGVELVRLCLDEVCAPSPADADTDTDTDADAGTGRSATGERIGVHGSLTSPGTWTVMWNNPGPADTVAVQALGADSEVLAEVITDLEFVRADSSNECGGPSSAEVMLDVPATLEPRD